MPNVTVAQLNQLIGNPDVYAVQRDSGGYYPVYERLSPSILRRHLQGELTVGTYLVKGDQARTLVLDFDSGDTALDEATTVRKALIELDVPERCIGLEFSGNKGYHLWVVCSQMIPANWLRRIGKAALAVAGTKAEVYPKQDQIRGDGLGNLVKLPEGIHRVTGNANTFVGPFPQPAAASVFKRIVDKLPEEATRTRTFSGTNPLECMAAVQAGCDDGWRNYGMFQFATNLRRAGIEDDALWAAMRTVNANFNPPLDDEEMEGVFASSRTSGPICDSIPEEHQCSVCPYRQQKLYAKPGQLRHGKQGELAVVEVGIRRPSGTVEIVHPDLEKGLVQVAE